MNNVIENTADQYSGIKWIVEALPTSGYSGKVDGKLFTNSRTTFKRLNVTSVGGWTNVTPKYTAAPVAYEPSAFAVTGKWQKRVFYL